MEEEQGRRDGWERILGVLILAAVVVVMLVSGVDYFAASRGARVGGSSPPSHGEASAPVFDPAKTLFVKGEGQVEAHVLAAFKERGWSPVDDPSLARAFWLLPRHLSTAAHHAAVVEVAQGLREGHGDFLDGHSIIWHMHMIKRESLSRRPLLQATLTHAKRSSYLAASLWNYTLPAFLLPSMCGDFLSYLSTSTDIAGATWTVSPKQDLPDAAATCARTRGSAGDMHAAVHALQEGGEAGKMGQAVVASEAIQHEAWDPSSVGRDPDTFYVQQLLPAPLKVVGGGGKSAVKGVAVLRAFVLLARPRPWMVMYKLGFAVATPLNAKGRETNVPLGALYKTSGGLPRATAKARVAAGAEAALRRFVCVFVTDKATAARATEGLHDNQHRFQLLQVDLAVASDYAVRVVGGGHADLDAKDEGAAVIPGVLEGALAVEEALSQGGGAAEGAREAAREGGWGVLLDEAEGGEGKCIDEP